MRHNILSRILLTCVVALTTTTAVNGQSFSSFILSGRATTLGMGDVSFLTPELAVQKIDAAVSFGQWKPGSLAYSTLQAGGFLALNESFGIRLDYRNNLFQAFDLVDENGNVKGSVKPGEQRILLGASFRLADVVFIDVNGKYLSADLAGNKASAFAGDVAVNYVKDGLTVGLKGLDIGSKYNYGSTAYSLPMRVMAGGSYRIAPGEKHAVTFGADLGYILPKEYGAFTAALGTEYAFNQMIYARAGYHFSSAVAPRFASFGLGFAFKGVGLDAAYLLGPSGNAWTVGLHVTL
ncbi:MAG: PorV/PorQ family protein [Bacteroidales bacterium]|nr:PorV/PorQ family protein [Bacteroidales bacterium]